MRTTRPLDTEIKKARIDCAKKFFVKITSNEVKYDIVSRYEKLIELAK